MDRYIDLISAQAAAQQADVAYAALKIAQASAWLSAFALLANFLIVLVAVRGPERERHVRDLEDRKRRARIEQRAATAGLRALAVVRHIEAYEKRYDISKNFDLQRIRNYKRRLRVRVKVINHFLSLQIRDVNLVGWLIETEEYASDVDRSIVANEIDDLYSPFAEAVDIIRHKEGRMSEVRAHYQRFASGKRLKDRLLQEDIDAVTSSIWYVNFFWTPSTPRD